MADGVQPLTHLTLTETPDGYLLEVGGQDGKSLALSVTPDQLDAIIEALEDLLTDEEDEVEEEEDEEEG